MFRVGLDSYSYHRLFGELRRGETRPAETWRDGALDPIREARALGVDVVTLQSCYLPPAAEVDPAPILEAARPVEVLFEWGHPTGLELGTRPDRTEDLLAWINVARRAGSTLMRMVCGGPGLRGVDPPDVQIERTLPHLVRAAQAAEDAGVALAIENHGDLTAAQIVELIDRAGARDLGVCFDTANAARVGDDPVETIHSLGRRVKMVHLKDVVPLDQVRDYVAGPRAVPYGTGMIDVEGVVAALADVGFDGPLCVEIAQIEPPDDDEHALVRQGVAWLRARAAAA